MEGLFVTSHFTSFGLSRFTAAEPPPLAVAAGERPSLLRRAVRERCSRRPGVYGMLDESGELIYVGKAKSLRARLLSYFRSRSRDPKAGRLLRRTRAIVWENATSEFAALLRELELIQRWRPAWNVQGRPRNHWRTYVCLGRRPAPYLFLTRRPPADTLACYGPVSAGRRTRDAVRWLNDSFRLRDCPQPQEMIFADQAELFPTARAAGCLRLEIGTCLGPCVGVCTRAQYGQAVRGVRAFLDGRDAGLLQSLEQEMAANSSALAFERAAPLRDKLDALKNLDAALDRLRVARDRLSFVYPLSGCQRENLWYLIQRGHVVHVLAAPTDHASRRQAARLLKDIYGKPTVRLGETRTGELDTVLLVAAWFRRFPRETERTLRPEEALAMCR
jgi:excinuclease ABC subunit C